VMLCAVCGMLCGVWGVRCCILIQKLSFLLPQVRHGRRIGRVPLGSRSSGTNPLINDITTV
jgi:hypothetical protein